MQSIYDNFRRGFMRVVDIILPPVCVLSGEMVERQGMLSPSAWHKLNFIIAPQCRICGIPFEYDMAGGDAEALECASCVAVSPSYDRARAALVYDDVSRDMILAFKHADKTYHSLSFVPWLRQAGLDMLEEADYLMPVPLHRSRLWKRRYNQAALLVQGLSQETGIPSMMQGLVRMRPTPSQGHMNAKDRAKNVRGAFAVAEDALEKLQGKRVVLIDDVYTSGATVNECARVLKQAGASGVDILTVTRVVKEGMRF